MEATETINPNGSIERTITLNPEESQATLDRLDPAIRTMVEERLNQSITNLPAIQMSAEELERICDEAVGIAANTEEDNQTIVEPVEYEEIEDTVEALEAFDNEMSATENPEETMTQEESVAPTVYNTQLNSVTTTRFSGAEWFTKINEQDIVIGGAGGISSWLTFLLARTNAGHITIYDNDKVEAVNLAGQFFGIHDVGIYKVVAVNKQVREFADYYMLDYNYTLYDIHSKVSPVMMCGFDNMEARKLFFRKWKSNLVGNPNPETFLFIDGRLSAECLQVLCIQGDDDQAIKAYEEQYLFSDDMADATVCSYKQTSFMANMIAATMVNIFVNWCANQVGSFRPVPFFTEYDAVTMQYKLKMNAV
jgi:hypothetical protein